MKHATVPHSRPWIDELDRIAVENVLLTGLIANGEMVGKFERSVCDYINARYGVVCRSGTAALYLALKTLGIKHGDEIVLPTYVCKDVLEAVTTIGATPRLCDINERGVITAESVQKILGPNTRAIIAVHVFGHACDIDSLLRLGIPVIEDACQAFGLQASQNRFAGTLGTIGVFSFQATKCLTTGEGGMLITKDHYLYERARKFTDPEKLCGATGAPQITDLQAALGISQLQRYEKFLHRRREIFEAYNIVAGQLKWASLGFPREASFLFRYTLCAKNGFEAVQSSFLARGVQTRRGVDELLHRRLGLHDADFPCACLKFTQTISVPFHPSLTSSEQEMVITAMREVFGGH